MEESQPTSAAYDALEALEEEEKNDPTDHGNTTSMIQLHRMMQMKEHKLLEHYSGPGRKAKKDKRKRQRAAKRRNRK